jgi:hypothetical protein
MVLEMLCIPFYSRKRLASRNGMFRLLIKIDKLWKKHFHFVTYVSRTCNNSGFSAYLKQKKSYYYACPSKSVAVIIITASTGNRNFHLYT